jgi:arylsulfatase A-like enzyme
MIVRWPGRVTAGAVSDQVWAFWDFLPTAAELAGVKPPRDIDGISVVPALLGTRQETHEFLYWEFFERGFQQAVRYDKWKAIRLTQGQPLVLYDVTKDPAEENDVSAEHPDVVAKIESYLEIARTESEYWP